MKDFLEWYHAEETKNVIEGIKEKYQDYISKEIGNEYLKYVDKEEQKKVLNYDEVE